MWQFLWHEDEDEEQENTDTAGQAEDGGCPYRHGQSHWSRCIVHWSQPDGGCCHYYCYYYYYRYFYYYFYYYYFYYFHYYTTSSTTSSTGKKNKNDVGTSSTSKTTSDKKEVEIVMDYATVHNYLTAARSEIDNLLQDIVGNTMVDCVNDDAYIHTYIYTYIHHTYIYSNRTQHKYIMHSPKICNHIHTCMYIHNMHE